MITALQQNLIREITGRYNPVLVGIFGSYARNENTSKSDLDVLIDLPSNLDLLELIGLEQELSEALGVSVDLVTAKSVNERLKPYINKDLVRII